MPYKMDDEFERYEDGYLKRLAGGKPALAASNEQRRAKLHEERLNAAKNTADKAKLDSWDYAVLEMVRRFDMAGPLKFGTVRTSEALLKLYRKGLIRRLDRGPTFDELERIHAFLDSDAYKRYAERLNRIMTNEVKERLGIIQEIIGAKNQTDLLDVTERGGHALKSKRAEIVTLYEKMDGQYNNDRASFYKNVPSYEWALPMLATMGFAGPVMGYMLASSDAQYAALDPKTLELGDFDAGGGDFGASGFDFGGF